MTVCIRTSRWHLGLTALLLGAALVACGGNGSTPPPGPAPTVSSTSPTNAATGVAINSAVAASFSKAIDPTTITGTNFTVKQGATAVAGTVSYAGVTATFKPAQLLAPGSTFTATMAGAKDMAGTALANNFVWTFTTGSSQDTTAPVVSSTAPAGGATAVGTNSGVTATFSKAMSSSTLTTASFTVTANGQPVAGSVTYSGNTASFHPAAALAVNTVFTATIATGAKDLAGNSLAAIYAWSFTTGAAADTTPPTVTSTNPASNAVGVAATASISATFSKSMAPLTISNTSFTVSGPGGAAVSGSVTFDPQTRVATFQPASSFAANTVFTAKVAGGASGVADLASNVLVSDFNWSFTSGGHVGLAPVLLGTSGNYVILAQTAVSTVPTSAITGDVAISPAAASYITGFGLTAATGYATAPQVVGKVYAADYAAPTPSNLTTAVTDMGTAYTDAAGRPTPDFLELGTGAIGGRTLTPGLYKWTSTVTIPSDVTLTGSATDVWIFQISGDLTQSSATKVLLSGGATPKNIFWQVAGTVDLGTTSHFEGIILSQTAITMRTGASMNGRALAQSAVGLDSSTVTQPAP